MESLANKFDGAVSPLTIAICVLLVLVGIVKLADYLDIRKTEQCDELMRDSITFNNNPTREQLMVIMNHKRFKQTPTNFQNAVRGKLKAYNMVPTAIEATMSPAQLYETGSLLWTQGLSIKAIYHFAYLVPIMTSEKVPLTNYMDDYARDCKNGMNPCDVRDIQMKKYGL